MNNQKSDTFEGIPKFAIIIAVTHSIKCLSECLESLGKLDYSKELFNDKNVEFAGYRVEHPLIDEATVSISAKNPKKAIKDAIKRLQKQVDDFQAQVKKLK